MLIFYPDWRYHVDMTAAKAIQLALQAKHRALEANQRRLEKRLKEIDAQLQSLDVNLTEGQKEVEFNKVFTSG